MNKLPFNTLENCINHKWIGGNPSLRIKLKIIIFTDQKIEIIITTIKYAWTNKYFIVVNLGTSMTKSHESNSKKISKITNLVAPPNNTTK